MKQHIDSIQLNELSDNSKEKLRNWWIKNIKQFDLYIDVSQPEEGILTISCCEDETTDEDELPLFSIGQMVQFLDEYGKFTLDKHFVKRWAWGQDEELCDNLWKHVKEILENMKT